LTSIAIEPNQVTSQGPRYAVAALFFFSGCTSLVYQVLWMRELSLFFGSDVYSAAVVLSCFMAGLSLGSFAIGHRAERLARPLRGYGLCEIGIGLCALAFGAALDALLPLHQSIYRGWFDAEPWRYQLFRLSVAAVMLLIPTSLMGATLPLIVRRFSDGTSGLGKSSGFFYAINTAGALAGVLIVSFVLLPLLGIQRTTWIAVAGNILIGLYALRLSARDRAVPQRRVEPSPARAAVASPATRTALVAIFISGLAALALEVVWTRILIQSFSATVYSFSVMLCCFLFGIAYGSDRAAGAVDRVERPLVILAWIELALAASVLVLGLLTQAVPALFGRALWTLVTATGGSFAAASVIATFLVSALLILIPTMLLGATFPAAIRACAATATSGAKATGRVYAANTLGGIVGALVGGMVLIPSFGSKGALAAIGVVFFVNGAWILWRAGGVPQLLRTPVLALSVACAAVLAVVVSLPNRIVINFNQQQDTTPEVVYHGEGIAHTVDIVRNQNRDTIMMVDGNPEADTSYLQRRHFILKGHLPLLLHEQPRDVAVVGLGLGVTLGATARHPGLENIDVIELTPEMVAAHAPLESVTGGILKNPLVDIRIDDGRNFLAMTDRSFDMITADPIHPRISGVGYLYSTQYYEAVRRRLRPNGIVCQWMPMYQISRESFDVAFRSFATVFPNASFWYVRGHGLFVGSLQPLSIDYARVAATMMDARVREDLDSIDIGSPEALLGHMLMGPEQIAGYLASTGRDDLNTDDNGYLEYRTPFEYLEPMQNIMTALLPHSGLAHAVIQGVPEATRAEIQRQWDARKAAILPELSDPALTDQ
jgi:spermidine synthase